MGSQEPINQQDWLVTPTLNCNVYLEARFLCEFGLLPLIEQDLVNAPLQLVSQLRMGMMTLMLLMLGGCLLQLRAALLQRTSVLLTLFHVALPPSVHLLNLAPYNSNTDVNINTNINVNVLPSVL